MFFISTTSFAATNINKDQVTAKDLLKLNSKYQNTKIELNTQIVNKPQKVYDLKSLADEKSLNQLFADSENTPLIKFKSLNEFESFLDKVEEFNNTVKTSINYINVATRSSEINDSYTFTWNSSLVWHYLLLSWDTLVDKNVRVTFTYKWIDGNPQFIKYNDVSSWISGTVIARSWTQQGKAVVNINSTNYSNDTLDIKLTGLYTLGVNVQVGDTTFPIGLSNTQTWTPKLIIHEIE